MLFLLPFLIFMSFCTTPNYFYAFVLCILNTNHERKQPVKKIIFNFLSIFPLLSVIFSSVKCWSWAGTLLHSPNVQSGISLCSSRAFCAGLFCLMPISSGLPRYYPLLPASWNWHISQVPKNQPFFTSFLLFHVQGTQMFSICHHCPCHLQGVTLQKSSSHALLCFPSFDIYTVVLPWSSKAPKVHFHLSS